MLAYERCAAAMVQTSLIAGLGMATFAMSAFMPTQRFGLMMVATLAAALVGDLVLLPALLSGPLGRYFAANLRSKSSGTTPAGMEDSATVGYSIPIAVPPTELTESFWLRNKKVSSLADDAPLPNNQPNFTLEPATVGATTDEVETPAWPISPAPQVRHDRPQVAFPPHGELFDRLRKLRHEHSRGD